LNRTMQIRNCNVVMIFCTWVGVKQGASCMKHSDTMDSRMLPRRFEERRWAIGESGSPQSIGKSAEFERDQWLKPLIKFDRR
jgi:hypothetical protein